MSFRDSAREFALVKARELEGMARQIGIMRSVDATESAAWLTEIATAIRVAAGDQPEADRPPRKAER